MLIKFLKMLFLVDILQGLAVTFKYYISPKVTIEYPEKVKKPTERFRGILRLYRDESGEPLCIACKNCQRGCPEYCFDIEGQRDENNKMRPVKFDWKLERCTFCGFCVETCPTKAIRFSKEFRLSTLDRRTLIFHIQDMYKYDSELQKYFLGELKK
jgi:NADH-quinone oxidoreductase subunit I